MCVWKRNGVPSTALTWKVLLRFIYTSSIIHLIPSKWGSWRLLGLFLTESWTLHGPLEFVYTFFTLCVLLVFCVLTGCESNQCSSSFDKTHPGNSDPQTHFRRKEIDRVFAHLNSAHASMTRFSTSKFNCRKWKTLIYWNATRKGSDNQWIPDPVSFSFLFNFCSFFMDSVAAFLAHIHTNKCVFATRHLKCSKRGCVGRKDWERKMFEDSSSFKTSAISTGLPQFNQTGKESFVRFWIHSKSRLWGHAYINTLFKLWMLVDAEVYISKLVFSPVIFRFFSS